MGPTRVATVRVSPPAEGPRPLPGPGRARLPGAGSLPPGGVRLATALLGASPRVAAVDPGTCRLDARGWGRRGGETALATRIRAVVAGEGLGEPRIGIADSALAADAAAARAGGGREGASVGGPLREGASAGGPFPGLLIVPSGGDAAFLAPLSLGLLPIPGELRDTLRAAGLRRIGEVAARPAAELEARFGPEGLQLHRLAEGRDDRAFRPLRSPDLPEASLELPGGVETLEPLLFALRGLIARVGAELRDAGRRASALELELRVEGREDRRTLRPARPTAREAALFDLCRAALEEGKGPRSGGPVDGLVLRVGGTSAEEARQGDLFARTWRDPLAASGALSRLRARLGEAAVAVPAPRPDHRPEGRNAWEPVPHGRPSASAGPHGSEAGGGGDSRAALPPALRLLPRPRAVRVRDRGGRPRVLWDGETRHEVEAAEGPERLSGDWWERPYRREYFRLCTAAGELLWVFREPRAGGDRWWLHGWWD